MSAKDDQMRSFLESGKTEEREHVFKNVFAVSRGFADDSHDDFKPVRPAFCPPRGPACFGRTAEDLLLLLCLLSSIQGFRVGACFQHTLPESFLLTNSKHVCRNASFCRVQKVHASGSEEIAEVIAKDIADNRVVLFMKGSADAPQCGFSNMACRILDHHGAEYATRNVLASDELRQARGGTEVSEISCLHSAHFCGGVVLRHIFPPSVVVVSLLGEM